MFYDGVMWLGLICISVNTLANSEQFTALLIFMLVIYTVVHWELTWNNALTNVSGERLILKMH